MDINGHPFTVVGVTPHGFQGSMTALAYDVWVPMMMQPVVMPGADRLPQRDNHWLSAFGRLAPGATASQACDELDALTRQMAADRAAYTDIGVSVVLLRDSSDGAISVLRPVLLALAMVAALVLIIACANLANLMLARGASRRREIAIRSSMGASRSRIVRQLLSESVIIAAGGAAVALVIARWTAGLLMLFAPPTEFPISLNVPLDVRVFLFTGAAAAVTALFFGLVPALQASRGDYTPALKDGSQGAGSSRRRLRDALVVAEVSLSLALLVAAGLCVRSVQKARQFDPGRVFFRQLLDRLQALPGAESVTLARRVPLGFTGNSSAGVIIDGYQPKAGESVSLSYNPVGPDYLKTMQIPLAGGRDIAMTDARGAPHVAVISETTARRYWRDRDPIGGRFRFQGEDDWITVIGVARDVKMRALNEQPRPFAYLPVLRATRVDPVRALKYE